MCGLDCWGLVRVVYKNELGIDLPVLPGIIKHDRLVVTREVSERCQEGWTDLESPVELCAVAMSQSKMIHHAGIWTSADGGKIIHAFDGFPVQADSLTTLRLRGLNIIKYLWYGIHR